MKKGTYYSYRQGQCMCGCDDLSQCTICGELMKAYQEDDGDGDHLKCANAIKAENEESWDELLKDVKPND